MKAIINMVLYTVNQRDLIMKRAALLLCILASSNAAADGLYLESGLAYNPDAFGVTSHTLARIGFIYQTTLSDVWEMDISAEHESDPYNSGVNDMISHEAYGITLRNKIW